MNANGQQALIWRCYMNTLDGNAIHVTIFPNIVYGGGCKLCITRLPMGYHAIDWRKGNIIVETFPRICYDCMRRFNDTYDAAFMRLRWFHASKARLLPLGDVCGVIAAVLGDLVSPADVYWSLS